MKEKDEQRKTDAKRDNVSTFQALSGRDIPLERGERAAAAGRVRRGVGVDVAAGAGARVGGETGALATIVAVAVAAEAGARVGGEIGAVATIVAVAVAVCSSFTQPPAMLGKGGQLGTHREGREGG